jgi:hypothetical protein
VFPPLRFKLPPELPEVLEAFLAEVPLAETEREREDTLAEVGAREDAEAELVSASEIASETGARGWPGLEAKAASAEALDEESVSGAAAETLEAPVELGAPLLFA